MATITVEGIPDGLLARLLVAAGGSGRSLSREVVVQLARSVGCAREHRRPYTVQAGSWCAEGGCRCAARRVETRAVGWGGPAG
jgi:plasmid stability protein